MDQTLTQFLASGYRQKEIVDYAIGPQTGISEAEAREMIEIALRLVDCVTGMLAQEPSP